MWSAALALKKKCSSLISSRFGTFQKSICYGPWCWTLVFVHPEAVKMAPSGPIIYFLSDLFRGAGTQPWLLASQSLLRFCQLNKCQLPVTTGQVEFTENLFHPEPTHDVFPDAKLFVTTLVLLYLTLCFVHSRGGKVKGQHCNHRAKKLEPPFEQWYNSLLQK